MPANCVNLDALVPRQDFVAGDDVASKDDTPAAIKVVDLVHKQAFFLNALRKPDFQRETAAWTPAKVLDLIHGFVHGDLVPTLILWNSPSNFNFVIDGGHRLSSIIAWVNNDYGDGVISREFFGNNISEYQLRIAERTRRMVNKSIGSFREIQDAVNYHSAKDEHKEIAKSLASRGLRIQWAPGDAKQAERSFFKINEQGVALDKTELTLLHSRKCPNAMAARAVNQRGAGHPYWKQFDKPIREEIERYAREIHKILFEPPLLTDAIKTQELPIAGRSSAAGALSLLLNTVNLTNGIELTRAPRSQSDAEKLVPADGDGSATVQFLKNTYKSVERMFSGDPASLDLHPLVYFYSNNGRHQPSSFLAMVALVNEFRADKNKHFPRFVKLRKRFEEFWIAHKDFAPQVVRETRGESKAVHGIKNLYIFVLNRIEEGCDDETIVRNLQSSKEFKMLKVLSEEPVAPGAEFHPKIVSQAYIEHALKSCVHCKLCGARVPDRGLSSDHDTPK